MNFYLAGVLIVVGLFSLTALSIRILFQIKKTRIEIKESVNPKFIKYTPEVSGLVKLAIEVWRLKKRSTAILSETTLSEAQLSAFESSIRNLFRYLETNDIELRDYASEKFTDGLNVEVLSAEGDGPKGVTIKETIEPSIFFKGNLINKSKVIIQKEGSDG